MESSIVEQSGILYHSAAHLMAAAVCRLFPDVQLDIGRDTEDGLYFYYDFDLPHRLAPEDFPRIEAEMTSLAKAAIPFERLEVTRAEATRLLAGQRYKLERLADIPAGETISLYRCDGFVDLCRGPHVATTADIGAFKLTAVAGSYYRGDEKNPMLQRLYGMAAPTRAELDAAVERLEEAKRRDHRRLGRELDLFSIHDEIGPGLALWHPKGARIRVAIEDYWRREHYRGGYEMVFTPHVGRAQLWETSGHLGFYRDSMYPPMTVTEDEGHAAARAEQYFVKPMNCPFHIQIYRSRKWSYRDLPVRWAELGTVYRFEKEGVRHGLLRVRGFTQDDAHIFCTPAQIESEIRRTLGFALGILRRFGFCEITAFLATRPEKSVGLPERWEQATVALENALKAEGLPYERDIGGGAFYGPKIDLKIRDALGRPWQLSTIQFDFNEPERFAMTYVGEDGQEHQPYMVHRALLGSLERFFGILIEHYGGAFPVWLAPEQVRVLPLSEKQLDYGRRVADELRGGGVRVSVDEAADKLGAKIRRAQMEKIPYMLVVGGREAEAGVVAVRSREKGDQGAVPLATFMEQIRTETQA
ncbi:MAG: threonine--tRNA ligase [Kiritimatiellae bacterium]|nr:threonine--tRNA ligase [Kiritimatiellia bacterium]